MAEKKKKKKLHGKFGAKYGRKNRARYLEIDVKQRQKQDCPYCSGPSKRAGSGVFLCKKCGAKFTANAYTVQ